MTIALVTRCISSLDALFRELASLSLTSTMQQPPPPAAGDMSDSRKRSFDAQQQQPTASTSAGDTADGSAAAAQDAAKRLKSDGAEDSAATAEATTRRLTMARRYLAQQTHPVVIPSYSTWFDLSLIHPIERRSLPEFFNGKNRSKTPSVYKDYRDFMIHTHRLNPTEYLTVTACRRNLAGDVCAIMRVHAFLEQWGLINYQVSPARHTRACLGAATATAAKHRLTLGRAAAQIDLDTRPSALGPPFTGHFRILVDTPRGLAPLHPGTQPSATSAGTPLRKDIIQTSSSSKPDMRLTGEQAQGIASAVDSAAGSQDDQPLSIEIRPCSTCGTTTSSTQYTSLSRSTATAAGTNGKQVVLCPPCYHEGRFPSTLHSGDFIKLDQSPYAHATGSSRAWTDQETLLLLEGLEMYDDEWDRVSSHVGTRTKDDCIVHFLALPIEDPFLEQTQREIGPLQYARGGPMSKEDNPVVSVMAFLAESVGKDVAAKAAGESVEALEKRLRGMAAQKESADGAEDKGEKAKGDEAMDVDASAGDKAADSTMAHGDDESKDGSSARQNVARAATVALGSAAAKSHLLALEEDASLHTLVTSVVEAQVTKLQLKLAHFEELEQLLEVERRSVEMQRQQVYEDRLGVNRMMSEVRALLSQAKEDPKSVDQERLNAVGRMAQTAQMKMATPVEVGQGQAEGVTPGSQASAPDVNGSFAQMS